MMVMTSAQYFRWFRYGMDPYNWIEEDSLMASVYPREIGYLRFLNEIERINTVVNLAEDPWPDDWSQEASITCHHFPIEDMSIPSEGQVQDFIKVMDNAPGPVMVHCAAGIGRTGTMIGLYLVDKGMAPEEAIQIIRKKRRGSIQTSAQEKMIYDWAKRTRD